MSCDNYCSNRYKTAFPELYHLPASASCAVMISLVPVQGRVPRSPGRRSPCPIPRAPGSKGLEFCSPKGASHLTPQQRAALGAGGCGQPRLGVQLLPCRAGTVWGCCFGCPPWATAALWPQSRGPSRNSLLFADLWGWARNPPGRVPEVAELGGPPGRPSVSVVGCVLWGRLVARQAQCLLLVPGAGTNPREWVRVPPKTQTKKEACVGTDRFLHIEGLQQGQECSCLKLKWSFQSKLKLVKATTNICDLLTKAFLAILEMYPVPIIVSA